MICRNAQNLMGPYLDGELDAGWIVQIESHLADCPRCDRELQQQRKLHASLVNPALRHTTPAGLRDTVAAAMKNASVANDSTQPTASPGEPATFTLPKQAPVRRSLFRMYALAAMIAIIAGAALLAPLAFNHRTESGPAVADVIPAHIRSLQLGEQSLIHVASSDQHTVAPWFAGKIDFAPPVRDLATQGFPLVGGRLDYLRDRPAAALVYRHRNHDINLFITKADSGVADVPPRAAELQGFNTVAWVHGGLAFTAVSNMNATDLRVLADAYRTAAGQ